jgi:hypothetical protein
MSVEHDEPATPAQAMQPVDVNARLEMLHQASMSPEPVEDHLKKPAEDHPIEDEDPKKSAEDHPPPHPGSLEDVHARLTALEAWAKTTPGMLYQAPPMASGAKVVAFYKSVDGTFSKHVMEPIDYASAKAHDPKSWSDVAPESGATVIDKTKGIPLSQPAAAPDKK